MLRSLPLVAAVAVEAETVNPPGPVNSAPTATSASITTAEDTASAPATPSVTDPDAGDTHTFTIVTPPAYGTAAVVNNRLVYTPSRELQRARQLYLQRERRRPIGRRHGDGDRHAGQRRADRDERQTSSTNEDTASAPTTPTVTDPDAGDTHTFAIVTQPAHGAAAVVNNRLVYTPSANYNGPTALPSARATAPYRWSARRR